MPSICQEILYHAGWTVGWSNHEKKLSLVRRIKIVGYVDPVKIQAENLFDPTNQRECNVSIHLTEIKHSTK